METIRRAESGDIPGVMRLLEQVNRIHHEGRPDLFKWPATKFSPAELEEIFRDENRPVFVCADEEGRVLGYAICIHEQILNSSIRTDVKTLHIDDLCVDEAERGRHIGRRLYEHVLDYARGAGCYNVTLNVWSLNPAAMAFYEKCGLKPQKIGMEQIL